MSHFIPNVLISLAITMQRIADDVAAGYHHQICGTIPLDRALEVLAKFNARYGFDREKNQRYRRKQKGLANFRLHLYPVRGTTRVWFLILRTDGVQEEADNEQWQDVRTKAGRIRVEDRYELVRLPVSRRLLRAYQASGRTGNSETWTWRMTPSHIEYWKSRVRESVNQLSAQRGDRQLRQLIYSLSHAPGFRGVRADIFGLQCYLDKCWKRALGYKKKIAKGKRLKDNRMPQQAPRIKPRTLEKRACKAYSLLHSIKRYQEGRRGWFRDRHPGDLAAEFIDFDG